MRASPLCEVSSVQNEADGTLWCRHQYVADQVLQLNSLTVCEALKTHYRNAKDEKKRYKRSDLLYDLQCGWLCYEPHAGDLDLQLCVWSGHQEVLAVLAS